MITKGSRASLLLAGTLAVSLTSCGLIDDAVKAGRVASKAEDAAQAAGKGSEAAAGQKAGRAKESEESPAVAEEATTRAGEEGAETVFEADEDSSGGQSKR